jgi:hypothetical protein
MIHVVTVHWRSPQWIVPQLDYLRSAISGDYRVLAALNGIEDRTLWAPFDYAEDLPGHHAEKLGALAAQVVTQADAEDVIIFLDSDAFPVRPLDRWLRETLAAHPLAAVQRRENFGDLRPHPSFCATTVGTWVDIAGDWRRGPWTAPGGVVLEDAGTDVARSLEEHGLDWLPLVRTNTTDLHPLWFGVYGHWIYHHGAGSRSMWSVLDDQRVFTEASLLDPSLGSLAEKYREHPRALLDLRPSDLAVLPAASARTVRQIRKRLILRTTERQSNRIFERLTTDADFYREFDAWRPPAGS